MAYSELANWDGGGGSGGGGSGSVNVNGVCMGEASSVQKYPQKHSNSQSYTDVKPQPQPQSQPSHRRSRDDISKAHISLTSTSTPTSSNKSNKRIRMDMGDREGSRTRPLSSLEIAMMRKSSEEEMDEVEEVVFGVGGGDVVEDSEGEGVELTDAILLLDRGGDQRLGLGLVNGAGQKSHKINPQSHSEKEIRLLSPLTELTEESDMIETPIPSFIKPQHFSSSNKKSNCGLSQLASSSSSILTESDASRVIRSSEKEKKRRRVEEKRSREERPPSLHDASSQSYTKTNKPSPSKYTLSYSNSDLISRTTTFSTLSNATSFVSNNAEASSSRLQQRQHILSSKPASGSSQKTISSNTSLSTKLDPTARASSRQRYVFSHAYSLSSTNAKMNGSRQHFPSSRSSPHKTQTQRMVGGERQSSPLRAVSVISVRSRSDSPPTPKALLKNPPPPSQSQIQTQPQSQPQSQSPIKSQSTLQSQSQPLSEQDLEPPMKRQVLEYVLVPPFCAPYTKGAYRWVGGPQGMSGYFSDTNSEIAVRDKRDKEVLVPSTGQVDADEDERDVIDLMDIDDDDDDDDDDDGSEYGKKGRGRGRGKRKGRGSGRYRYEQGIRSASSFTSRSVSRSRSQSARGRKNNSNIDGGVTSVNDTKRKSRTRKDRSVSRVSTSTRTSVSTKVNHSSKSGSSSKKKKSQTAYVDDDGNYENGDVVELVVDVDLTFCHQCRRKTAHDKMRCTSIFENGEKCGMRYCVRCITYRYPQITFTSYPSVFVCPKCTDTCNCTSCCARRGEVYISSGRGNQTRRIDEVMESLGMDVSMFRNVDVMRVQPSVVPSGGKTSTNGGLKKKKTQSVSKSSGDSFRMRIGRKVSPPPPLVDREAENWISARTIGRGVIRAGDEEKGERKRPRIFIGSVQESWFATDPEILKDDGVVDPTAESAEFSPRPRLLLKFSQMDCVSADSLEGEENNVIGKGKGKERTLSTTPRPRRRAYIGDPINVSSKAIPPSFDSIEIFIQHHKLLYPEPESAYTYDENGIRRSKRPRKPSNRLFGTGYGSEFDEAYDYGYEVDGRSDGDENDGDDDRWGVGSSGKGGKGKKGSKKYNGSRTRKANSDGFVPEFTLNHASGSSTLSSMTPLDRPNAFLGIADSSSPVHEPTYTMDIEEHLDTFDDDAQGANDRLAYIPWSTAGYEEYDAYNPLQAESISQNLLTDNEPLSSTPPSSHSSHLGLKMSDIFHEFEIGDHGTADSLAFPLTDQSLSLDNPADYLPLTSFGDDDPIERVGSTSINNNSNKYTAIEKSKLLEEGMTEEDVGRALNAALFALQA